MPLRKRRLYRHAWGTYVTQAGADLLAFEESNGWRNLLITGLHHDTARKRSFVYVRWEDDPEKNLGLIVPFGCSLDDLKAEAAKAVKELAIELTSATVVSP